MKKDHVDPSKDTELGTQNVSNATMWVENEKDVSIQTRDLESYLNEKSDGEFRNVAAFAETVHDAENQMNMEEMDMEQCLEWFEEDHNEAFNFTSEFAEELVREEMPNRAEKIRNHNKAIAEQKKKDDLLIKHSNKLLEAAETQKSHFRKTINRLEQELQETYNNWEASELTNREEMEKLRDELKKEKKKNTEKSNATPEVKEVEQKCKHCRFTCKDTKRLENHMTAVHIKEVGQKCKECRFTCKDSMTLDKHRGPTSNVRISNVRIASYHHYFTAS